MEAPTAAKPLFLQDDNAKPHRAKVGGVLVVDLICAMGLEEFRIHIVPLDPRQPPQSPDTNMLDLCVFRGMSLIFRRVRAESLVKSLMNGPRRSADHADDEAGLEAESEGDQEDAMDHFDDNDAEDEFLVRRVPLRCGMSRFKRNGEEAKAKCPGCQKIVRDSDSEATCCDMRNSWWHKECAQKLLGQKGYERAIDPAAVESDESWVCPQCMHHLCRSDHRVRELCLFCGKPSVRSGDDAGRDMVTCDGDWCGLFHQKCVRYDAEHEEEEGNEAWYCLACSLVPDEEDEEGEEVPTIEEHVCHENSVQGVLAAIDKALAGLSRDFFERGFESRRVFLEKIVASGGRNDYDMHYRGERKRKAKELERANKNN
jgi:hypothetical protein